MAMPNEHRVSINPQGKKNIKDSMNKADESLIESTKQQSNSATSRCEVMDTMDTKAVDTVQKSRRNEITMKKNLGEEVRVCLDFGSMRNGLPSTDEDFEEKNASETVHFHTKKLNLG